MARKIVLTSGKGGVGKTTVCANLGMALANRSQRVVAVDLDVGLNNLDVTLGLDNRVVFDLVDVLENRCRVTQALLKVEVAPTFFVMPSCHQSVRMFTPDNVKRIINRLDEQFDYVLIDCPAGMDQGFMRAVNCADEGLVVCTPHLSSVRDADKVVRHLATKENFPLAVVVNRVRGDLVAQGKMLSPMEVFSLLGQRPLGIIGEDDEVNCFGQSANVAFTILADNLHFGTQKLMDVVSQHKNFWRRLFNI